MVYDENGNILDAVYDKNGTSLQYAYDKVGNEIFSGETPFVPTTLAYDTNYLIKEAWLTNAATQRDAVKAKFIASKDAVPFFIQTDGHGRYNEGNKGCHNLAEPIMQYIPNIMLGDYESYYYDGSNPTNHARTSAGISNYISAMGNHEFMPSTAEGSLIADLPTLVASYTPSRAILGSQTYGYYKILDDTYNVKWIVSQPHIPDGSVSSGFLWKITGDQYEWLIDEMESDDGYDIVFIQHEELNTTYTQPDGTTYTRNYTGMNVGPLLAARKTKTSGTFTDADGVVHSYDFRNADSDLLCSLHGHRHYEAYVDKTVYGFPGYVGNEFDGAGCSCYGLIDRAGGKLYIYSFSNAAVNEPIVLDL